MSERSVEQTIFGIVALLVLVVLAAASGILPWAMFAGMGTSISVGIVTRKLVAAMIAGAAVTAVVSAFGIGVMLSSG